MRGHIFRIGDKVGFDVELSDCTLRSAVVKSDRTMLLREPIELIVESSSLFGAAEESVRLEANVAHVFEDGSGVIVAFDADDRLQLVNAETSDLFSAGTTSDEIAKRPPIFDSEWWNVGESQADTMKVAPPSATDPPPLLEDGMTVLFQSTEHFAKQYETNISKGTILLQPTTFDLGARRKLALLVPGRQPLEVWVSIGSRGHDAIACAIDSFDQVRVELERLGA